MHLVKSILAGCALSAICTAATVTLQNGVNGYNGTTDTYFHTPSGGYGGGPGPGLNSVPPVEPSTDKKLYVIENG